jgi:NADH-quinone oxidoreductase subunit L
MRRMGGLRKYLPVTFVTFFIGWLAIAGVPPLSGFWSKDEILAGAWSSGPAGPALWAIGILVALLTAFYMTRQLIMVFFGPDHTPRESPWTMLLPLVVLAGLAVIAGILNLPFSDQFKRLEHWLYPVIVYENPLPSAPVLFGLASGAITTAVVGIWLGFFVYYKKRIDAKKIEKPVLANGWYIDETFARIVGGPGEAGFQGIADFDGKIIDGAVDAVGAGTLGLGGRLRGLQTGLVRSYALGIAVGAVALLAFIVTRMNL